MRSLIALAVSVAIASHCIAQTETEKLLAGSDPAIQAQLGEVFDSQSDVDVFQRLEKLAKMADDKEMLVKQFAIFAVAAPNKEEFHVLETLAVFYRLQMQFGWQGTAFIRALAPYLDSENEDLRDFVQMWFHSHDSNDRIHGKPPLGSVNYHEYMEYVRARLGRNEEIPDGFIEYIYERNPGKALLVFAYAMGVENMVAKMQAMREAIDRQRGRVLTREDKELQREKQEQLEARSDAIRKERSAILLAEHIVSKAIWLEEHNFDHRFQKALPEAQQELKKLSEHDYWWARLYVAHIMHRHPELRDAAVLDKLTEDDNELVRKAAKGEKRLRESDDKSASVPLVAPRNVEARPLGGGKALIEWQASEGATSYSIQRRRPDTEKEFTTIATDVKETIYIDNAGDSGVLYEYRVIAHAPDKATVP